MVRQHVKNVTFSYIVDEGDKNLTVQFLPEIHHARHFYASIKIVPFRAYMIRKYHLKMSEKRIKFQVWNFITYELMNNRGYFTAENNNIGLLIPSKR